MSTFWKYGLLIVTLAALVIGAWHVSAGADEDEDGDLSLEALATAIAKAKITLSTACDTAAKAAKGQAFAAELEVEDGKVLYDVFVLVPGAPPKLFEVEVDAVTGEVIEIEEEKVGGDDDDDDDDDGDDDDEDDDEEGDDD